MLLLRIRNQLRALRAQTLATTSSKNAYLVRNNWATKPRTCNIIIDHRKLLYCARARRSARSAINPSLINYLIGKQLNSLSITNSRNEYWMSSMVHSQHRSWHHRIFLFFSAGNSDNDFFQTLERRHSNKKNTKSQLFGMIFLN